MKNKKIIIFLIVLFSIITILLTIFFIGILTNKQWFYFNGFKNISKTSNQLVLDKTFNAHYDTIHIDAKVSDIQILNGNENQLRVRIYGDKKYTTVDSDNQRLDIASSSKPCIGFCFNQEKSKIEVYLPSSYSNKIIIQNNYGDVKIGRFKNLIVDAKLDAGDIKIDTILSGVIKNNYGDIELKKYAKKLDIEDDCGDIKISEVDHIKAANNYGDITIGKVNDFLNIQDDCGDIKIDSIYLKQNSSIQNNLGNIEIGKTNEIYLDAKTDLGDVEINHNYQKSDITLKMRNDCGDIEVEN